jgi:hypothetical protein
MVHVRSRIAVFTLFLALIIVACEKDATTPTGPAGAGSTASLAKFSGSQTYPVSVFATDLNNPRGLKFGPDGYLYVAEGGLGGMNSTRGQCDSVVAPTGPYTGGMTARISRISRSGERSTVADYLPSSQTSAALGSLVSGVADVQFIGHQLYAILAGAGCSHGVPGVPNAVIKVEENGSWSVLSDLSAFQMAHHVANPNADDFEPDGTWYSMIRVGGDLFAVEPNHGELDKIDPHSGNVQRVIDISASQGHIVPTAVTYRHRAFYVGNLYTFPIVDGSSSVYKISPAGNISVWATGFTTILGLEFDKKGRLYVLENTTGNPFPTPGTGTILRINKSGTRDTIATHLFLQTALTVGPDRNLYVSNKGFGPPIPGFGEVLKIDLHDSADRDDEDDD